MESPSFLLQFQEPVCPERTENPIVAGTHTITEAREESDQDDHNLETLLCATQTKTAAPEERDQDDCQYGFDAIPRLKECS